MAKTTTFTIEIEPGLLAEFMAAAEAAPWAGDGHDVPVDTRMDRSTTRAA